jgi:hypothetical protein
VPGDQRQQNVIWSQSTVVYAGTAALFGYMFTRMVTVGGGSYGSVFMVGGIALALAVVINLLEEFLLMSQSTEKTPTERRLTAV